MRVFCSSIVKLSLFVGRQFVAENQKLAAKKVTCFILPDREKNMKLAFALPTPNRNHSTLEFPHLIRRISQCSNSCRYLPDSEYLVDVDNMQHNLK